MDVIEHINENKYYEMGNEKEYYNLWIAYFNNNKDFINGNLLDIVNKTDFMDNLNCFYSLAITIFILERYINKLLEK